MKKDNTKIKYFGYNRKSTEDKESQILSLKSQDKAMQEIARRETLEVVKTFKEAKSAKLPDKRPVFAEMIQRIKRGEASGILTWELSRLARNADEAGQIIGMLQRGEIKHIKTYGKDYYSDDNIVIPYIEFGIANQFSRDLSRNVKRGLNNKAMAGWRPCLAPLGYKNSRIKLKGEQDISSDLERFSLVKQIFETMLTGNYTVPKLLEYTNEVLGLKLSATQNRPARKLGLSHLYRILTNTFYYGWYNWNGEWVQGNHDKMITEAEYDRIQFLMGRKGRPRPKAHKFAFTGLMRCGSCGAGVTCEEKWKHQKNGNTHHYIYYRCTKKINPNCTEKSVELKELNKQVDATLARLKISDKFKNWAIRYLHEIRESEAQSQETTLEIKQKSLSQKTKQLDNLLLKYTSTENTDGQLISDQEYQGLKSRLSKERATLIEDLSTHNEKITEWVELGEKTFNFARYAQVWFAKGDLETKRAVFACLGSHLLLKDRKVAITLRKPFNFIFEGLPGVSKELKRLEPLKIPVNTEQFNSFSKQFPLMSG